MVILCLGGLSQTGESPMFRFICRRPSTLRSVSKTMIYPPEECPLPARPDGLPFGRRSQRHASRVGSHVLNRPGIAVRSPLD